MARSFLACSSYFDELNKVNLLKLDNSNQVVNRAFQHPEVCKDSKDMEYYSATLVCCPYLTV